MHFRSTSLIRFAIFSISRNWKRASCCVINLQCFFSSSADLAISGTVLITSTVDHKRHPKTSRNSCCILWKFILNPLDRPSELNMAWLFIVGSKLVSDYTNELKGGKRENDDIGSFGNIIYWWTKSFFRFVTFFCLLGMWKACFIYYCKGLELLYQVEVIIIIIDGVFFNSLKNIGKICNSNPFTPLLEASFQCSGNNKKDMRSWRWERGFG